MSYEDEGRTDHLACAKELLDLIDNLHGDELDQTADLERGASAHALVDIAQSFRQFNSDRSQWYREVLEVLTAAKDGDGSLRSGQPAAATSCQVCGRLGSDLFCKSGELTWDQWMDHFDAFHRERRAAGATRMQAHDFADEMMSDRFGPCPEKP